MMKNKHAVELGRLGGKARSSKKTRAVRNNGRQGGRPAKQSIQNWTSFFDAVDEARRKRDFTALRKLFRTSLRLREQALINATVRALAKECKSVVPVWAEKPLTLREPFFVSGIENLKATALVETPLEFKLNNIFVLSNFLKRV